MYLQRIQVWSVIFLLLLQILLFSCNKKDNNVKEDSISKLNQVVLIFNGFPADYRIYFKGGNNGPYSPAFPEVRYFDDHFIQRSIKPQRETIDTVVIPCSRNSIEFQHTVKGYDYYDYLFLNGDTVLFTYEDKIPEAKVLNRPTSAIEINYDKIHRQLVCHNDYPALTKVIAPMLFASYGTMFVAKEGQREGILGEIDQIKADAELTLPQELIREHEVLDSLFEADLLSQKAYDWLSQKAETKRTVDQGFNGKLNRSQITRLTKASDTLLFFHTYRSLIRTINSNLYERRVKRISRSNSILPDYTIVYDSLLNSTLFSNQVKQILLFETSDQLLQNNSTSTIARHLKKIEHDLHDSTYLNYFYAKYNLDKPVSNELELIDLAGTKTTLSKFVSTNKGNIIYVDFWASWCAPCIQEFKSSHALNNKLKEQKVVFVYLSIDEDKSKWKAASKKYGLSSSFMVSNKNTSHFLENIHFNTIPRYLIYNKEGNLHTDNALRPSDSNIYQLLQNLANHKTM